MNDQKKQIAKLLRRVKKLLLEKKNIFFDKENPVLISYDDIDVGKLTITVDENCLVNVGVFFNNEEDSVNYLENLRSNFFELVPLGDVI